MDWDGRVCSVVFTQGCNLNCRYCHNRSLIPRDEDLAGIPVDDILDELARRRGFIDGVVISGGEPTLHGGLGAFIERVRSLGLAVKLDTNGTNPDLLYDLFVKDLLDYVAMDLKAPRAKLDFLCGGVDEADRIEVSTDLLLSSGIDHEFRTTLAPQLTHEDLLELAARIRGARRYVLQQYRPPVRQSGPAASQPHSVAWIMNAVERVRAIIPECRVRGLDLPRTLQAHAS